ncbi:hypothetical protein INR49_014930 [Caranx melampygus]|nr:hypothetical protein INR49_014930 [Caranx melampygus]
MTLHAKNTVKKKKRWREERLLASGAHPVTEAQTHLLTQQHHDVLSFICTFSFSSFYKQNKVRTDSRLKTEIDTQRLT